MKRAIRLFASVLVPAFILTAQPAIGQNMAKDATPHAEKGKATQKILLDNDKVQVYETWFKPGDESANIARPYRVIHTLSGGTLLRTYADGKTEKRVEKTGDTRDSGPDPAYSAKNVGKTTIHVYVVAWKQAK
jgi:hypothetical protein